jgi:hypothetical protein
MYRLCVSLLAGAAVLALPAAGWGGGAKGAAKGKSDPPGAPVEAKLVAKKSAYPLDLGGKSAAEFRQALKEAEKTGRYPAAPAVDLVLELKNTSDKEVQIWTSGDPVRLMLDLKGKAAVNEALKGIAFTLEFRMPKATVVAPGKSVEIPIKQLSYGMRGASHRSYWLEPGEYTLTASYQTGVSPAPKGSTPAEGGFGKVMLTTAPIKLKVEAK